MTEALAAAGASVVIVDIDEEPIAEALGAVGGNVIGHRADVSNEQEVNGIVEAALTHFGSIDVLINNAGISMSAIREGDRYVNPVYFWELDAEWLQRFFAVHVMGPFMLTMAALPHMRTQEFGRIVNVTTSLSTMLSGTNQPYGMMKAASEALCSSISKDLAGSKVTANILIPGGAADTRFVPDTPTRSRDVLVKPAVMGPPAVFLASHDADEVNGRRLIAKAWDPANSDDENLIAATAPIGWPSE